MNYYAVILKIANLRNLCERSRGTMKGKLTGIILALFVAISCTGRQDAEELVATGREQLSGKDYAQAMITLREAEKLVGNDTLLSAELHRLLGRCLEAVGNHPDAISCLIASTREYGSVGKEANARQSLYETGLAYSGIGDLVQAEQALKTVVHGARAAADTIMEAYALSAYANVCLEKDPQEPSRAVNMLIRVRDELRCPLSGSEKGLMAYAWSLLGDRQKARYWLDAAAADVSSPEELAVLRFREYQIAKREGNCGRALGALEEVVSGSEGGRDVRDSVMILQGEYISRQNDLAKARAQASGMRTLFLIAVLMAAAFAVSGYFRAQKIAAERELEKERQETERYMNLAEELKGRLKKSSRTDVLERLCENYYIYEGTDNLQPKVLSEVKSVISGLRENPKTLQELEDNLNLGHDGVVRKFREQVPRLKDEDVKLFVFAASGLSSTAMSTLLGMEKSVVYNRIYRLKGRIAKAGAPDGEIFLQLLNG